jgi:plasmid stabilization system protein ParE
MALEIRWTLEAFDDLDEILAYIESKFGLESAQIAFGKISTSIKLLASFPEMRKAVKNDIRAIIVSKRSIVFYRFDESHLIVLNVFFKGQNKRA